jgi:hypothetical protein
MYRHTLSEVNPFLAPSVSSSGGTAFRPLPTRDKIPRKEAARAVSRPFCYNNSDE